MDRSNWDEEQINRLNMENRPTETMALDFINPELKRLSSGKSHFLKSFGYNFDKESLSPSDAAVLVCSREHEDMSRCRRKLSPKREVRLELECGSGERNKKVWTNKVPRRCWPRGVSLLSRKSPSNFDIFIKYGPRIGDGIFSFFAISSPLWFLMRERGETRVRRSRRGYERSIGIKSGGTCDEYDEVPWSIVDKYANKMFQDEEMFFILDDVRLLCTCMRRLCKKRYAQ